MSDENQAEEQFTNENVEQPDEKKMLMQRLRLMQVPFSNAASVETLRKKLREKLGTDSETNPEIKSESEEPTEEPVVESVVETTEETTGSLEQAITELHLNQSPETYRPQLDHDQNGQNGGSLSDAEKAELEALRAKVKELEAETIRQALEAQPKEPVLNPLAGDTAAQKPSAHMTKRDKVRKEALKLIRVRIANMDPKKAGIPGEILCVGNKYVGTIRKYIPYSAEQTENGYHLPKILYDELEGRKFLHIRTFKDRQTGRERQETTWQKEFALEVLPPLTAQQLAELAAAQRASGSVE